LLERIISPTWWCRVRVTGWPTPVETFAPWWFVMSNLGARMRSKLSPSWLGLQGKGAYKSIVFRRGVN